MKVQVRGSSGRAGRPSGWPVGRTGPPGRVGQRRSYTRYRATVTGRCPGTAPHARQHAGYTAYAPDLSTRCGRPYGPVTTWHPVRCTHRTAHTEPCRSPRSAPTSHAPAHAPCRTRAAAGCRAPAHAGRHARRSTAAPCRWCLHIPEQGRACAVREAWPPPTRPRQQAAPGSRPGRPAGSWALIVQTTGGGALTQPGWNSADGSGPSKGTRGMVRLARPSTDLGGAITSSSPPR